METYQIASWLRDKAVRSGNHSWERVMMMAAKRLEELTKRIEELERDLLATEAARDALSKQTIILQTEKKEPKLDLTPQVYKNGYQPVGFIGFARACPTCKNIGSENCYECKLERVSGYEPKEDYHES